MLSSSTRAKILESRLLPLLVFPYRCRLIIRYLFGALQKYINDRLQQHRHGNEIDSEAFFGRRIGWYAIVRATKPKIIVEAGTKKGIGVSMKGL